MEQITAQEKTRVRFALVEYRDHPPQDDSFAVRVHPFTESISAARKAVNGMAADGGGDGPESIADAIFETTQLDWRKDSVKICVVISDAPAHGMASGNGDGFPDGCPCGHDPHALMQWFRKNEVIIYSVGCEPAIDRKTVALLKSWSWMTGGQYATIDFNNSM